MSTECDLCNKESVFAFGDGTRLCRECVVQAANHRGLLHEIKRLRQRVKELDKLLDKVGTAANENGFDSIAALLEWLPELAALKAGQGDPEKL